MLRAYSREVVGADQPRAGRHSTFIPALAQSIRAATRPRCEVAHAARTAGESKYWLYRLIRLNFDLMTGFSVVPLQLFTLFGIVVASWRTALRRLPAGAALHRARPRGRGRVHALRDRVLVDGRAAWRASASSASTSAASTRKCGDDRGSSIRAGLRRGPGRDDSDERRNRASSCLPTTTWATPASRPPRARRERPRRLHPHDDPGESSGSAPWPSSPRSRHPAVTRTSTCKTRTNDIEVFAALEPDLIFSFYYRDMIQRGDPRARRGSARSTCTARCCPKYRGRAPVNWAVVLGEKETGVTLPHDDSGPTPATSWTRKRVPIGPEDTGHRRAATRARRRRAACSSGSSTRSWPARRRGARRTVAGRHQFGGRRPEDGRIDWSRPARRRPQSRARRDAALSGRVHRGRRRRSSSSGARAGRTPSRRRARSRARSRCNGDHASRRVRRRPLARDSSRRR